MLHFTHTVGEQEIKGQILSVERRKEKTMLLSVIKEKLMINLSFPLA